MRLARLVQRAHADFQRWDRVRERLLDDSRQLIRACGALIKGFHRGQFGARLWTPADRLLSQILRATQRAPEFRRAGFVQQALGEYAEAALLERSLSPQIGADRLARLPGDALLLGVADTIGELRRHCLDRLLQDDAKGAQRALKQMESLFEVLTDAEAPDALVPLRAKRDAARAILERTRGDVVNARKTKELEKKIDNLGSLLDEAEGRVRKKPQAADADDLDLDAAWNHKS
jgi:translin